MSDAQEPAASIDELRAEVASSMGPLLPEIAPAIADFVKKYAYGEIWSREGLSPRDRSIATIAGLVALNCPMELKMHALRGLSNGLSQQEIGEVILHMMPYAGIPLTVAAAEAVGEVVPRAAPGDKMTGHGY